MVDNYSVEEVGQSYRYCTVQLSLFSLLMVMGLCGGCGGFTLAAIVAVLDVSGVIEIGKEKSLFAGFLAFPVVGILYGILFSIMGYPVYAWVCKSIRGQKLSGLFINPHN